MLAPTMRYLLLDSNRDPGPYASLLLRAITIVHSKHHRYTHAEQLSLIHISEPTRPY